MANRSQNAEELKTLKLSFRLSDFEPSEADAAEEPDDPVCDVEANAYEVRPGIYRIAGPQSLIPFGPCGPLLSLGSVIQAEPQGDRTCRYVRTLESPSVWTRLVAPVRLEVIGRADVKRHFDALLDLGCGWEWCAGNVTIQGLQSGPAPESSEAVSDAISALENLLVGRSGAPTEPRAPAVARLPPHPPRNQNMSDDRTLYDAIGVSPTATPWEINQACLKLGEQYRSDRQLNDPVAHARFQEIEKAFETLTDSKKRAHYDQNLRNKASPPGVLAYLGLFLLLVLIPLHFVGFMYQWFVNGYDIAKQTAPLGYILFVIAALVSYVMAIPYLARRGYSRLATTMFILGSVFAVGALLYALGWFPSPTDCEVTRGGYACR